MKLQISTEYLIIVSFSLMVLVPLVLFLYDYSIRQQEEYNLLLASEAVKKIGEASDYVYLQGEPSKLTIKIVVPKNIERIVIANRTITFRIKVYGGITDVYYNTIGEVYGNLPKDAGEYYILVQATRGGVFLNVSTS